MFNGINPVPGGYYQQQYLGSKDSSISGHMEDAIYGSDEFRMYAYKIKRCPIMRSHDWTECPYAHKGERATRRDPRKYSYCAVVCPAFRTGTCHKGELCEFAHGVFEYWLHPARYRTRACNAGTLCQRKVCFFAHSPDQLRPEIIFKSNPGIAVHCGTTMSSGDGATSSMTRHQQHQIVLDDDDSDSFEKFAEFLKTLRALKISDGEEEKNSAVVDATSFEYSELPHIKWISELVQ